MNNFAMPGLNSDGEDLFDFEAASSYTLGASTHNNLGAHVHTVQDEEAVHVLPLTQSEIEAILAMRALKAQDFHQGYDLAPPELHDNFSGLEEPGARETSPNYDGAGILLPTTLDGLDVPDYGNTQLNAVDGFTTLAQFQFEEPAEVFRALTDCTPYAADQSSARLNPPPIPIYKHTKQALDNDISNTVGFSLTQTGETVQQPKQMPAWSVGDKCPWPQCASRAVFKTKASFNMHVTNVHTKPLLCSVANCSQKTPFGRRSDLRRHHQSAHSAEREFVCSIISCNAHIKEFARKDHLMKHMRERHDRYFCPLNHCFDNTKMMMTNFTSDSLRDHLTNHHGVAELRTNIVCKRADTDGSKTATEADLRFSTWGECKTCEKRPYVTKE